MKKRSPRITPFLLSAFVAPGAGHLYRRELLKGLFILGLCLAGFVWMFFDLYSIVRASLEAKPLTDPANIIERAIEIRHSFSLRRFVPPLIVIGLSYIWGLVDILWKMRKEKNSFRLR